MSLKLTKHQVFIGAAIVAVIFFFTIVGVYKWQAKQKSDFTASVTAMQEMMRKTERFSAFVSRIETDSRAFSLTAHPSFLEGYVFAKKQVGLLADTLLHQLNSNPQQENALDSLLKLTSNRITFADSLLNLIPPVKKENALTLANRESGEDYLTNTRRLINQIQAEESRSLEKARLLIDQDSRMIQILMLSIAAGILALLAFLFWKLYGYGKFTSNVTEKRRTTEELTGSVSLSRDNLVKKKMQEEITHLANLVEHTSEAIFSRGFDRRIISWNRGAERLFGFTRLEAVGKTPIELQLTGRSLQDIEAAELSIFKNGSWVEELQHRRKDGSTFYGAVTGSVVENANGEMGAFYFIVKDITDRKKLEEELRQTNEDLEQKVKLRTAEILRNEEQYRQLFQNNPMPMWVFETSSLKFLDVNEMATLSYGYTKEEFLRMTLKDIRPEKDRSLFLKTDHAFNMHTIDNNHEVWNHVKKDGTIIQVEISAHEISFSGQPARLILANDVTERIKAATTLDSSEKRFRTLIENSHDIISLMDADFNILYRSPSTHRITGWTNEEILNLNGTTNIHPADKEVFKAKIQEILSHPEKPLDVYFRSRHKSGHYIWLEGTIVNLLQQAHVGAIVFNARDVSGRVAAEERNREILNELSDYKIALDESSIVAITDDTGTITYVNDNFCRISKYSRQELLGSNHRIVNSGLHPEAFFQSLWSTIAAGQVWKGEIRNKAKDGTIYWVDTTIVPFMNDEGKPYQYVAIRADITERKGSEARLRASEKQFRHSMDNMLEGVQIIGFDWRYKYVNNAMARQGRLTKEELLGNTVMEKYPGIEETSIYKLYERCFTDRLPIHCENEFIFPDESTVWFELSFLPVPEGIFVLSIDITERKLAGEAIKTMNTQLEERVATRTAQLKKANEELEAFSYSVSHDLRAPLRAILGFSVILEEDYGCNLGAEGNRITSVIKSNTLKMGNLIDDLLTFSRMGRSEIVKAVVDNNEIVAEVLSSLDIVKYPGIRWNVKALPSARGDMNLMRQVWANLIQNAAKYSAHSKPPEIEIGSFTEEGGVVFFVKDNGVGFDDRYSNKLFKVFQRLHSGEEFEGTGIGLAIVEKVVSRHGGKVWARATVNKGAEFYFFLPMDDAGSEM